jgi:hypothetical protein
MRHPLSDRGALLGDFGIGMAAALGGKPRRARNRWPSAGATLDLDFVNRQAYVRGIGVCALSDVIAYSGGAGGTRVNGVGQIVAANGMRFDHDPVTMACKGLLVEEQRTNLLIQSAAFDSASWNGAAGSSYVVSPNVLTAPDGTLSADILIVPNGSVLALTAGKYLAAQAQSQNAGLLAAGTYTFTAYAKQGAYDILQLRVGSNTTLSAGNYGIAQFSLVDGSVLSSSGAESAVVASSQALSGGWFRLSVTFTTIAAHAMFAGFWIWNSTPAAGDGASGTYVWGAQLEAGAFAASHIPTAGAQVTRPADNALLTDSNFTAWFNPAQGTFAAEFDATPAPAQANGVLGNSVNQSFLYSNNAHVITAYDGAQVNTAVSGIGSHKAASSYTAGSRMAITADNAAPVVAAHCAAGYTSVGSVFLGSISASSGFANGHIRRVRYWGTQLPDASLQALTA